MKALQTISPRLRSRDRCRWQDRNGVADCRRRERQRSATHKPLCASLEGFTLHAATRAGALHLAGREALLRYVLRSPLAQQRRQRGAGDLLRITLKRAYADGTVSVEMDPRRCCAGLPPAYRRRTFIL
jgi:hypothetical protein